MGSDDDFMIKREGRGADALASKMTWAGVAMMTLTNWSIAFTQGLGYFKYHLLLQPVALACFSYGILSLQPTSQPRTKAAGLQRHQTSIFTFGIPIITLGTLGVFYSKYVRGAPHYKTWHAKLGLACMIWTFIQMCVGGGSTWYDGALFGGGASAKALWKYHRLSGYILWGLMLFTAHLGGGWSHWGQNYTNAFVRFVAYTLSPGLMAAGVYLRVRPSKMKFL